MDISTITIMRGEYELIPKLLKNLDFAREIHIVETNKELLEENQKLMDENKKLSESIKQAQENPNMHVENIAREKFNLTMPDEEFIVFEEEGDNE